MVSYKVDTKQNFGTILFIILFSLFVLVSLRTSGSQTSESSNSSLQYGLAFGNNSNHFDAAIFNVVSLHDLYQNCVSDLHKSILDLFSFQYKISHYNHTIAQNFIDSQKTRLTIGPLFLWRFYYPLSLNERKDLPVLN